MKKTQLAAILLITTIALHAQTPTLEWAKGIGVTAPGDIPLASSNAIAVDLAGNIFTTGSYYETGDFDPGPGATILNAGKGNDIFISKLDADGDFVWAKTIGDTMECNATSIATDIDGNVYVTGYFYGTVDFDPGDDVFYLLHEEIQVKNTFVLKLDDDGNFMWAKNTTGKGYYTYASSRSIALDVSGNILLTGSYSGEVDFDPGNPVASVTSTNISTDFFISKYDNNGNFMWVKTIGDSLNQDAVSITSDANGDIYATGLFRGSVDFDPGAGESRITVGRGSNNMFVLKLDSDGNFDWAKKVGGDGHAHSIEATFIQLDADNNIYTTGSIHGTIDFDPSTSGVFNLSATRNNAFVLKLDAAGDFVWATAHENGTSAGRALALDAANNVYATGSFSQTVDFNPGDDIYNLSHAPTGFTEDAFVSKLDADGNFEWAYQLYGSAEGRNLTVDKLKNLYLTGVFEGTVDCDPDSSVALELTQPIGFFVQKLNQQMTIAVNEYDHENDISIYPNPVSDQLTLNVDATETNTPIEIKNLLGQTVYADVLKSGAGKQSMNINISGLSKGVYFIQLKNKDLISSKKFIKD